MKKKLSIEDLLYEEEGTTLDFKRENYKFLKESDHEKSELLKDILAFSNAWRRDDAYILIGVEEIKGGRSKVIGIEDAFDDAQLQEFVNKKTQRPIDFEYRTVAIDDKKVGVIKISVQQRPFYLEKDYGKLRRHTVYIRRGSSTSEADPDEICNMGRTEKIETLEIPTLSFEFANLETRQSLGKKLELEATLLNILPLKEIPDYSPGNIENLFPNFLSTINHSSINSLLINKDYYRDLVKYYYVRMRTAKLSFLLKNDSNQTISDITVEITIENVADKFYFYETRKLPDFPQSKRNPLMNPPIKLGNHNFISNRKSIQIHELNDSYRIEVPFEKVQPKQIVYYPEPIFIESNDSFLIDAKVKIFADNIPIPITQQLVISCNASIDDGSVEHIEEMHNKKYLNDSE